MEPEKKKTRKNNNKKNNVNQGSTLPTVQEQNEENNNQEQNEENKKSVISGITQVNNNENQLSLISTIRFDQQFTPEIINTILNMTGTEIGKGGFGRAERISLFGRTFVKKISLLSSKNKYFEAYRKRIFNNEVNTLNKFRGDKYFPFLYGAGIYTGRDGLEYGLIILEDIVGTDLFNLADSGRGLLEAESITIIHLIRKAIEHLHSLGYLHLDIKPENIIIRMDNNVIIGLILIDYGFAKQYAIPSRITKQLVPLPTTNLPQYFTRDYASDKLKNLHTKYIENIKKKEAISGPINRWTYNYDKHKAFAYKFSKQNNYNSFEKTRLLGLPSNVLIPNVDTPWALQHFDTDTQPRFFESTREQSLQNCLSDLAELLEEPGLDKTIRSALIVCINRIVRQKQNVQPPLTQLVSSSSTVSSIPQQTQSLHDLITNEDFSLEKFKRLVGNGADTNAVNSNNKTVLQVLQEKLAEIQKRGEIAMVPKMLNKHTALENKYKEAIAFVQAGIIQIGGKRKTRKSKKRSSK